MSSVCQLYHWALLSYRTHFRVVTARRVRDYFTKERPVSPGVDVEAVVRQLEVQCSKSKLLLELVDDRRPKKRAFEAKRRQVLAQPNGKAWLAFHGKTTDPKQALTTCCYGHTLTTSSPNTMLREVLALSLAVGSV